MAVYKEKCPTCGGQIEIQSGETYGVCDSCGNAISLSELSRLKIQRYEAERVTRATDAVLEYDAVFNIDEGRWLSNEELYEKIDLALETEEWTIASDYSNELLRRDPKNARGYLYKMLSEMHLYKKEDLAECGRDFGEYENYRLFFRFADDDLLGEINNYLENSRRKIEEERLECIYQKASLTFRQASTVDDFSVAVYYFSLIKGYKDSDDLLKKCTRSISIIQAARKKAKLKKKIIIFSIIGAILLAILIGVISKSAKYDVNRIEISMKNVRKEYDPDASPYTNGCYYIRYDYEILNGTGADIDYIEIEACFTSASGVSIGSITGTIGSYSSSMNLKAGERRTYARYISENQPEYNDFFRTLYNESFSSFKIEFKIKYVSFSDGEYYWN